MHQNLTTIMLDGIDYTVDADIRRHQAGRADRQARDIRMGADRGGAGT